MNKPEISWADMLRPRFEVVLQGVKAGSISHLKRLNNSWPKKPSEVKQGVEALLGHLSITTMPTTMKEGKALDKEDAHRILLLRTALEVIEDTVLDSNKDMSKECAAQAVNAFDEHLSDLIAALEFRTRHSAAIMPACSKEKATRLGNILEAQCVHGLIDLGLHHFEAQEGHHSLAALVDCLLRCWIRGAGSPQDTTLRPEEYRNISKVIDALMRCINEDSMRPLLLKSVASCDQRRLRLFAETFAYYCLEWSAVHAAAYEDNPLDLDCNQLATIISVSQVFAEEIPAFHHALLKVNFPSLALKIGRSFRRAPATMGCSGTIDTDIASRLVPGSLSRAWAVVHVLPDLLDSGLLELLIEDALTPGQRAMAKWSKQDPLKQICRVAHHPAVFQPLNAAEQRSSDLLQRADAHPVASQRFKLLPLALDIQDMLNERMSWIEQPLICACLEHDVVGTKVTSKVYECSNCRAVTYCSRKCQKRDWKMLHRDECARSRVHRMECELQGIWPSHLEQVTRLYALEVALRHSLRTPPPPELAFHPASRSPMQPIYIANAMHFPIGVGPCASTEDFFTLTGNETNKTPLFEDTRFRAMVHQAERNTEIQLIGSVSMLGEYWIVALAAFHLGRPCEAEDGKELREMLHGHVRLLASSS